jgi:uncharacterized protein
LQWCVHGHLHRHESQPIEVPEPGDGLLPGGVGTGGYAAAMAPRWQRALITGASTGLGASFARQLAAEGSELVLVARSADRLEALAHELPTQAEVVVADLADRVAVERVAGRIASLDQPVDLVVNNAGFGDGRHLVDAPPEVWSDMVQVNVWAVVRLTQAALARARRYGGLGGVVNVASVAGFAGSAGLGVYSATKSFLLTFGQAVHDEARADGVAVTTLCPGLTHTEFHQRAGLDLSLPDVAWQQPDEVVRAGLVGVARGRALVVPGLVNKGAVVGSRLVPLRVQRRVAGLVRGRR